ncbi:ABC transporter substrate-binding protein [Diaminobutyricibacter sp. McL0608]|uniref:ABC transporter substrate-binding protein n=1 Tax=Leifsonia sp. McL0608 TaxID=3143537 RepID=UPI0031F32397
MGIPVSSATAATEPPIGKTTFTVGTTSQVDSFNPLLGIESSATLVYDLMYDSLTQDSNKDLSLQPRLATSWSRSADGLTWTYHIRSGLKWSDGKPLTSKDVAYTLNRVISGGPAQANWGNFLTSVTKVTAPDEKTVLLHLDHPNATLPAIPIPIIPEHVWSHISDSQLTSFPNTPPNVVSSGPFRLVAGAAGSSTYQLEANPNYWGGRPKIDTLRFRVFKALDTEVQALVKGEIDFADGLSPLQVRALASRPGITGWPAIQSGVFDEIAFNTGSIDTKTGARIGDPNPAVLDPKFRYALNTAIDRAKIAKLAFMGGAKPATTVVTPDFSKFVWEPPRADAPRYDPAKAAELLTAAGYKRGHDGKLRLPNGAPMEPLRLIARPEDSSSLTTMELLKEWLGNLGIDSTVTSMDSTKLQNVILSGDYDIFEWGWSYAEDPDAMLIYFTCGQRGLLSDSWYCNSEYDKLYTAQKQQLDPAERSEQIKKMQAILYRDAPYLLTVYPMSEQAYRSDRFHGLNPKPMPNGSLLLDAASYLTVAPNVDAHGSAIALKGSSGSTENTNLIAIVGAGLAVLIAAGWAFARRRGKATAGDRE